MKKLVIAALLAAGVVGASAQGTMSPVSDTTSQISYGETYGELAGTFIKSTDGFTGAVFYQDQLITTLEFKPFSFGGTDYELGLLNVGGAEIENDLLPVGTTIDLTVGAYSDWNDATTTAQEAFDYVASVQGGYGVSDSFSYTTGVSASAGTPLPAEGTMKFNSFSVEIVPEPTTIALGILGLGGLFLLRRRS